MRRAHHSPATSAHREDHRLAVALLLLTLLLCRSIDVVIFLKVLLTHRDVVHPAVASLFFANSIFSTPLVFPILKRQGWARMTYVFLTFFGAIGFLAALFVTMNDQKGGELVPGAMKLFSMAAVTYAAAFGVAICKPVRHMTARRWS